MRIIKMSIIAALILFLLPIESYSQFSKSPFDSRRGNQALTFKKKKSSAKNRSLKKRKKKQENKQTKAKESKKASFHQNIFFKGYSFDSFIRSTTSGNKIELGCAFAPLLVALRYDNHGYFSSRDYFSDPKNDPLTHGITPLVGTHVDSDYFGISLQTGLGAFWGYEPGYSIPVEASIQFPFIAIIPNQIRIGYLAKLGYAMSNTSQDGPFLGFGIVLIKAMGTRK